MLCACESSEYYSQAMVGQLEVLHKREDITDVIADEDTDDLLRLRLQQVLSIREFSQQILLLPVDDSYDSYVDLEREYVVWNVYAAGELSLKAKRWCFPIAGCIAYRGYFSPEPALEKAEALKAENYDVTVSGIRAYSTLGWFDDPILNTFINRQSLDLVVLLFHELSHRKLYIKDDTAFNESFATAVAEIGLNLWLLEHREKTDEYKVFLANRKVQKAFKRLLSEYRQKLLIVYEDEQLSDDEKRLAKKATFEALDVHYQQFKVKHHTEVYDHWMKTVNNAKLANLANYNQWVPAFLAIYQQQDSLEEFYQEVERIAELDKVLRQQALKQWLEPAVFTQ